LVIFVHVVTSVRLGVKCLKVAPLVIIKIWKVNQIARSVPGVSTAMLTPQHTLAMNVRQATTVLTGHPALNTNLATQERTIQRYKATPHWIAYHVMQVTTALAMETINQPTAAVQGFIVLEEMRKRNLVQHAVLEVTTANKDHTI